MIKFFRRIRQNLLSENLPSGQAGKFSKYMLYAIGEIVLVVIGILIALSINNWNEERKSNNTIKSVYAIIKSDLLSDIETIDKTLIDTKTNDSIFKLVINKDITSDDYKNCKPCITILYGFPDIKLKTRGLKLLEQNSTILNSYQDSLSINLFNFYSYFNTEIEAGVKEVWSDYDDNHYYFKNNKPWFTDYIEAKANLEFIEYALTSTDYMNRVNNFYNVFYGGYLGHLKKYKKYALFMIDDIEKEIK